jgi:very-short-patch-repair endonuclease
MGEERAVRDLAARQHGAFSRFQARQLGFTNRQMATRVASGAWLHVDNNVFVVAGSPLTWHQRLTAAVLSRPEALVAGRSAAHLHGIPGFPRSRPEILLPFPGNARSPLARTIRSRHFDRLARVTVEGFETTTVAETILTLSFREPTSVVARVIDDQIAARRLRIEDFDPIFERLENARMRGLAGLRRVVAERDYKAYQPPTSELERLLYILLDRPELPRFERQLPISYPSRQATVDAYIPEWGLIIEADGRRWHSRAKDFEVDRARDNAAVAQGLRVVRFTYRMLTEDPDGCLAILLQAGLRIPA